MTEDEAKTKWCCGPRMTAMALLAQTARSGSADQAASVGYCIASACMAWRWAVAPTENLVPTPGVAMGAKRVTEGGDGYCGLAGAPQ